MHMIFFMPKVNIKKKFDICHIYLNIIMKELFLEIFKL